MRPPVSPLFPYTTLFRSILLLLGKALGERIHFLLELFGVANVSDLCIPSILGLALGGGQLLPDGLGGFALDRKSTRLNSSHITTSYAVSCLKKKTLYRAP